MRSVKVHRRSSTHQTTADVPLNRNLIADIPPMPVHFCCRWRLRLQQNGLSTSTPSKAPTRSAGPAHDWARSRDPGRPGDFDWLCLVCLSFAAGSSTGSSALRRRRLPPLDVATSERRDVPVELKGIGIVQAYNTVTPPDQWSDHAGRFHRGSTDSSGRCVFMYVFCSRNCIRPSPRAPGTRRSGPMRSGTLPHGPTFPCRGFVSCLKR